MRRAPEKLKNFDVPSYDSVFIGGSNMAVEGHRLYPKWRAALEKVIDVKTARDARTQGTPAWTAWEAQLQKAYMAYDEVAREV